MLKILTINSYSQYRINGWYIRFLTFLYLIILLFEGCITGEQQLCPDTVPNCGNKNMPSAAMGSTCISRCTDFEGALYCTIAGNDWGWCADQKGSCGNGKYFQFAHQPKILFKS